MTSKKVGVSILYVAIFLQLAAYLAHDTGRLSDGPLYSSLLLVLSATALVAAVWIYRGRRAG